MSSSFQCLDHSLLNNEGGKNKEWRLDQSRNPCCHSKPKHSSTGLISLGFWLCSSPRAPFNPVCFGVMPIKVQALVLTPGSKNRDPSWQMVGNMVHKRSNKVLLYVKHGTLPMALWHYLFSPHAAK